MPDVILAVLDHPAATPRAARIGMASCRTVRRRPDQRDAGANAARGIGIAQRRGADVATRGGAAQQRRGSHGRGPRRVRRLVSGRTARDRREMDRTRRHRRPAGRGTRPARRLSRRRAARAPRLRHELARLARGRVHHRSACPRGAGALTQEFGRRVAIAWRDDGRATKAVLSALHCLRKAEHVFVSTGTRGDATPQVPQSWRSMASRRTCLCFPSAPACLVPLCSTGHMRSAPTCWSWVLISTRRCASSSGRRYATHAAPHGTCRCCCGTDGYEGNNRIN